MTPFSIFSGRSNPRPGPGRVVSRRRPARRGRGLWAAAVAAVAVMCLAASSLAAPPAPRLTVTAPGALTANWTIVAQVHGHPAAWIAQRSGVPVVRLAQRLVHLTLHAGASDGGVL